MGEGRMPGQTEEALPLVERAGQALFGRVDNKRENSSNLKVHDELRNIFLALCVCVLHE